MNFLPSYSLSAPLKSPVPGSPGNKKFYAEESKVWLQKFPIILSTLVHKLLGFFKLLYMCGILHFNETKIP